MLIQDKKLEAEDIGRNVLYIPEHAHGDINHPDCEVGIISSWLDKYIFVRFIHVSKANGRPSVGTPCAVDPDSLRWW